MRTLLSLRAQRVPLISGSPFGVAAQARKNWGETARDGRFSAAKTGCLVSAAPVFPGLCGDRVSDDDVGVSFLLVYLLWTSKEDRPAPAGAEPQVTTKNEICVRNAHTTLTHLR